MPIFTVLPDFLQYKARGLTIAERIEACSMWEPMSGCLLWIGPWNAAGYGEIKINGKNQRAHRVVYEMVRGQIPDGLSLDHLCRTHCCVNPWHLEIVTHTENMRRKIYRRKTHCINGHELTPENSYSDPRKPQFVTCKICRAEATRRRGSNKTAREELYARIRLRKQTDPEYLERRRAQSRASKARHRAKLKT